MMAWVPFTLSGWGVVELSQEIPASALVIETVLVPLGVDSVVRATSYATLDVEGIVRTAIAIALITDAHLIEVITDEIGGDALLVRAGNHVTALSMVSRRLQATAINGSRGLSRGAIRTVLQSSRRISAIVNQFGTEVLNGGT